METDKSPKIMSIDFHTRFFPALLWKSLRPKQRTRSGFNSSLEPLIALVFCIILIAMSLPSAINNRSIAGWIVSGISMVGLIAMIIHSVASQWRKHPTYDDFLAGFFFFFVNLGLTAAIFMSTLGHYSSAKSFLTGAAGIIIGYVLGIIAGFALQYLGWIAAVLNSLATLMIFGMIVLDMVLLSGILSH